MDRQSVVRMKGSKVEQCRSSAKFVELSGETDRGAEDHRTLHVVGSTRSALDFD